MSHSPGAGEELLGMAEKEAFRLRDMSAMRTSRLGMITESSQALSCSNCVFATWLCSGRKSRVGEAREAGRVDLGNAIGQSATDSRWPGHASPQPAILLVTA